VDNRSFDIGHSVWGNGKAALTDDDQTGRRRLKRPGFFNELFQFSNALFEVPGVQKAAWASDERRHEHRIADGLEGREFGCFALGVEIADPGSLLPCPECFSGRGSGPMENEGTLFVDLAEGIVAKHRQLGRIPLGQSCETVALILPAFLNFSMIFHRVLLVEGVESAALDQAAHCNAIDQLF
jgi:hypothetical protein